MGSGSATTYDVMGNLGDLFEASPGCDLTSTTVNQYDLQCSNNIGTTQSSDVAGTTGGESGLPVGDVNPLDDYYANAPATGSGNGRNQVPNTGAEAGDPTDPLIGGPDGIAAFNTSFARSSSYSSNSELNYVGYATDGVSWVSEACIGNSATCANPNPDTNQAAPAGATEHWDVTNITKANLQAIWENTLSCTISSATVTMDWRCLQLAEGTKTPTQVAAEAADPIDCYTTQTASGTYSTWQGFLGFTKNVDPPCSSDNEAGDPGDPNATNDHNNLTENEMGVVDSASDAKYAIYFFSYGKFTQTCTANTQVITPAAGQSAQIQGTCIGQNANDVTQYGSISTSANNPSTLTPRRSRATATRRCDVPRPPGSLQRLRQQHGP